MSSERNWRSIGMAAGAVAALACAGLLLARHLLDDGEPSIAELIDDARDSVCDVFCEKCAGVFQMPMADYLREFDVRANASDGIKCRKCGMSTARSMGVVVPERRPPPGLADREEMLTVAELEEHMRTVGRQILELDAMLLDPAVASNPDRVRDITTEKRQLEGQREWLNLKFDDLLLRR